LAKRPIPQDTGPPKSKRAVVQRQHRVIDPFGGGEFAGQVLFDKVPKGDQHFDGQDGRKDNGESPVSFQPCEANEITAY